MAFAISLITFCKGRGAEAKQSLPPALAALRQGDELVLVDYGDPAAVGRWAASLGSPLLTVVHFAPAFWFHISHARNLGGRFSLGDILIFCDIDFIVTPVLIEECRAVGEREFLVQPRSTGEMGFIALRREAWLLVGGYEEAFCGYGEDDLFMRASLIRAGCKQRECLCRVHPVPEPDTCRIHEVESRNLNNRVNGQIGKALRRLHPFRANISRNWGAGGELLAESELRKHAGQARAELSR